MRKITRIFLIAMLLLFSLPLGLAIADSYTLYEYYNLNDDTDSELYLANYFGQTFTVGNDSHTMNAIRLKIFREGTTPGNLYVSIRGVDGSGDPTGLDLSTGAFEGILLTASSPGLWYEIPMTEYDLEANTTYAIVCYSTGTGATYNIHWRKDGSASAYADGKGTTSTNGGITWADVANTDYMFEIWGTPIEPTVEIDDVRIFSSFDNEDDWLVVARYNLIDVSHEYQDPAELWYLQLLDGDDDVVAQQPVRMWGTRPGSIYINTALGNSLEWGSDEYKVKLHSTYDDSYDFQYNLSDSNWFGSTLSQLDSWCIYTAKLMEDEDFATYTIQTLDYGDVLNVAGGALFERGIPGLSVIRPDIFYVTITDVGTWEDGSEYTHSYEEDLSDYETALGTQLSDILTDQEAITHLSGRWFGGLIVFALFAIVAGFGISKGHFAGGLMAGSLIIFAGAMVGLIPLSALFVIIAIGLLIFVKSYVWDRGA